MQPLSDVIRDELNSGGVSQELSDMVNFIMNAINTPVTPIQWEAVHIDDDANKRETEIFPNHPVIRYLIYFTCTHQLTFKINDDS